MSKPKMICPDCGAEMNHHAVKIDYGVDDPKFVDTVFAAQSKMRIHIPNAGELNCEQPNKTDVQG